MCHFGDDLPSYRPREAPHHSSGERRSSQEHAHRRDHWAILDGQGILTLGDEKRRVLADDTLSLPTGGVHRAENGGAGHLIIIRTEVGVCL
jgi:mannose-6-phosphate isomerase